MVSSSSEASRSYYAAPAGRGQMGDTPPGSYSLRPGLRIPIGLLRPLSEEEVVGGPHPPPPARAPPRPPPPPPPTPRAGRCAPAPRLGRTASPGLRGSPIGAGDSVVTGCDRFTDF